jgi:hypothetical protein
MSVLTIVADIGQLASALAAVAAIGIGVRTYKRQHNVDTFLHYTERYDAIMEKLPPWARTASRTSGALAKADDVRMACLAYLNMCAEEFYLWRKGYLSKDLWGIWEAEIIRTLRTELFVDYWAELEPEFKSYEEFRTFVNGNQEGLRPLPAAATAVLP